jgi:hypothetical protein
MVKNKAQQRAFVNMAPKPSIRPITNVNYTTAQIIPQERDCSAVLKIS